MKSAILEIVNEKGLHARASAKLAKTVQGFDRTKVTVKLCQTCQEVPADDVLELLTLGASKGKSIIVTTEGVYASEALKEVIRLVKNGFDE